MSPFLFSPKGQHCKSPVTTYHLVLPCPRDVSAPNNPSLEHCQSALTPARQLERALVQRALVSAQAVALLNMGGWGHIPDPTPYCLSKCLFLRLVRGVAKTDDRRGESKHASRVGLTASLRHNTSYQYSSFDAWQSSCPVIHLHSIQSAHLTTSNILARAAAAAPITRHHLHVRQCLRGGSHTRRMHFNLTKPFCLTSDSQSPSIVLNMS